MTPVTDPQAQLYEALAKAQGTFETITRDKTVKVTTKAGGSYTFKYAPLETILDAVRPMLAANGLAIVQLLTMNENGFPMLETRIVHAGGGFLTGQFPLKTDGLSAQELGSLVTYMRRYAVVCVLGIATEEDDDGNRAVGNTAAEPVGKAAEQLAEFVKLAEAYAVIDAGFDLDKTLVWARSAPIHKLKEACQKLSGQIDEALEQQQTLAGAV